MSEEVEGITTASGTEVDSADYDTPPCSDEEPREVSPLLKRPSEQELPEIRGCGPVKYHRTVRSARDLIPRFQTQVDYISWGSPPPSWWQDPDNTPAFCDIATLGKYPRVPNPGDKFITQGSPVCREYSAPPQMDRGDPKGVLYGTYPRGSELEALQVFPSLLPEDKVRGLPREWGITILVQSHFKPGVEAYVNVSRASIQFARLKASKYCRGTEWLDWEPEAHGQDRRFSGMPSSIKTPPPGFVKGRAQTAASQDSASQLQEEEATVQLKAVEWGTFLGALMDTANHNKNVDLDQLQWGALQDMPFTISLTDPDIPEAFRQDIRSLYLQNGWLEAGSTSSDFVTANMHNSIEGKASYACDGCARSGEAQTGIDVVQSATSNSPWRWGCRLCRRNWARDAPCALVLHLRYLDKSFSFFTRWPLAQWVRDHWPEVYYKAAGGLRYNLVIISTTSYLKYDPIPELRNGPPTDGVEHRLLVSDENQRAIWNIVCRDDSAASHTWKRVVFGTRVVQN